MKAVALFALFLSSACAEISTSTAFRLFKADYRNYLEETRRDSKDAGFMSIALRSSAPTIKEAIRGDCLRRKCASKLCRHAHMSGYIDRAVERTENRKR